MAEHPWVLVGPWYRSESIGGPPARQVTAPIFQKYGDTSFMERFVTEPQESLRFVCEDLTERLCLDPNQVVTPETLGQSNPGLKLFLDSHSRFYLVVCELHCVAPGFPSVRRDQVCETGFVIRRKVPLIQGEIRQKLAHMQYHHNRLKAACLKLADKMERKRTQHSIEELEKAKKIVFGKSQGILEKRLSKLQSQLKVSETELQQFIKAHGIQLQLQGWLPSPNNQEVGKWESVDPEPQIIEEKIYPLYPLTPDPNVDDHSAKGKTLWFGLVPTGSSDTDEQGNPQLDDNDLYEIRCFVRRKKDCCEGRGRNCCHGELVWSLPTASYRLASFFDLDGTSHKPINIKLPDLAALKRQADLGPPGRGVNVRTIAPPQSSLIFATDGMDMPEVDPDNRFRPGQQICFFGILLFFIVALFLFRLFLPIILFLFQLWFLLKLKFCIPPTASLDLGFAVDLEVLGPDIEAEFDVAADATIKINGVDYTRTELLNKLTEEIGRELGGESNFAAEVASKLALSGTPGSLSLNDLADLYIAMATDFSDEPEHSNLAGQVPRPEDGLIYFEKVTLQ